VFDERLADSRSHHNRTAYRFSILAARQTRCLSEMYAQIFGLPVSQWKVLPIIGYYGPMSAKEVGERSSLEPEKVTRAVDRLVVRGLVTRRPDAKDRRRVVLSLAGKGKQVFEQSEQLRAIIEEKFLAVLQAKERLAFHRILDKLESHAMVMFDGKQAWRRIVGGTSISTRGKPRAGLRERRVED
jgi:DNA-binding MarR family transcriptional regulator